MRKRQILDLEQLAREHPEQMTEAQWRAVLSSEAYRICRQHGTEPAFTGEYYHLAAEGAYHCRCCHAVLFSSDTKYDSGSGWPSFYAAIDKTAIEEVHDHGHGMSRIEILCSRCKAHLGHVFPDGPAPTGLRYCVNSLSLQLNEK